MAKNDYIHRKQQMEQAIFAAGENLGFQKLIDYMQLVLHDPEYMGKDTFSKQRLRRVLDGMEHYSRILDDAFCASKVDADILQRNLDAGLREIWGDDLIPFYERYPDLKRIKYDRGKKGWT